MPSTVVLTSVTRSGEKVFVNFADGTQLEYESLQALTDALAELDTDVDKTRLMALGWIRLRQPTLEDVSQIAGRDFTFDLSSTSPIRVP